MYQMVRRGEDPTLGSLGFSIPTWITNIAGAVLKGKQVSVPTPAGTVVVNLDNPTELAALASMLKGTKITSTATPVGVAASRPSFVDEVPGGWITIAAVGIGALLLFKRGLRG